MIKKKSEFWDKKNIRVNVSAGGKREKKRNSTGNSNAMKLYSEN